MEKRNAKVTTKGKTERRVGPDVEAGMNGAFALVKGREQVPRQTGVRKQRATAMDEGLFRGTIRNSRAAARRTVGHGGQAVCGSLRTEASERRAEG